MEALGLAVSLASLYAGCVDAFTLFRRGQHFLKDYQILVTKLDVERTLLLQWGDRVGVLRTDHRHRDRRLKESVTGAAVKDVLNTIRSLLTDAEDLRTKYGLAPDQIRGDRKDAVILSQSRMQKHIRRYNRFVNWARQNGKQLTALTTLRWTIQDREKFNCLLLDLSYFVKKLDELMPYSSPTRDRQMYEDLEALPPNQQLLQLIAEATVDDHPEWSEAASTRASTSDDQKSGRSARASMEIAANAFVREVADLDFWRSGMSVAKEFHENAENRTSAAHRGACSEPFPDLDVSGVSNTRPFGPLPRLDRRKYFDVCQYFQAKHRSLEFDIRALREVPAQLKNDAHTHSNPYILGTKINSFSAEFMQLVCDMLDAYFEWENARSYFVGSEQEDDSSLFEWCETRSSRLRHSWSMAAEEGSRTSPPDYFSDTIFKVFERRPAATEPLSRGLDSIRFIKSSIACIEMEERFWNALHAAASSGSTPETVRQEIVDQQQRHEFRLRIKEALSSIAIPNIPETMSIKDAEDLEDSFIDMWTSVSNSQATTPGFLTGNLERRSFIHSSSTWFAEGL